MTKEHRDLLIKSRDNWLAIRAGALKTVAIAEKQIDALGEMLGQDPIESAVTTRLQRRQLAGLQNGHNLVK